MKVQVYTSPTCGVCTAVKHYLRGRGVKYQEFDVSRDPDAYADMLALTDGAKTLPVVALGDQAVAGFDMDRLEQLLRAQD